MAARQPAFTQAQYQQAVQAQAQAQQAALIQQQQQQQRYMQAGYGAAGIDHSGIPTDPAVGMLDTHISTYRHASREYEAALKLLTDTRPARDPLIDSQVDAVALHRVLEGYLQATQSLVPVPGSLPPALCSPAPGNPPSSSGMVGGHSGDMTTLLLLGHSGNSHAAASSRSRPKLRPAVFKEASLSKEPLTALLRRVSETSQATFGESAARTLSDATMDRMTTLLHDLVRQARRRMLSSEVAKADAATVSPTSAGSGAVPLRSVLVSQPQAAFDAISADTRARERAAGDVAAGRMSDDMGAGAIASSSSSSADAAAGDSVSSSSSSSAAEAAGMGAGMGPDTDSSSVLFALGFGFGGGPGAAGGLGTSGAAGTAAVKTGGATGVGAGADAVGGGLKPSSAAGAAAAPRMPQGVEITLADLVAVLGADPRLRRSRVMEKAVASQDTEACAALDGLF